MSISLAASLSGYTTTSFQGAAQSAFVSGVAATLSVPTSAVAITSVTAAAAGRRSLAQAGVTVQFSVTTTAPSDSVGASLTSSLAAALTDAFTAAALPVPVVSAIAVLPSPPPPPPLPPAPPGGYSSPPPSPPPSPPSPYPPNPPPPSPSPLPPPSPSPPPSPPTCGTPCAFTLPAASAPFYLTIAEPFASFSAAQIARQRALALGLASRLNLPAADVQIVASGSLANSTLVTLRLVAANTATAASGVSTLSAHFRTNASSLAAAFACHGLAAPFSFATAPPMPPPPLATYAGLALSLQLALDIPIRTYLRSAPSNNAAIVAALAPLMGLDITELWVYSQLPLRPRGTVVYLDAVTPASDTTGTGMGMLQPTAAFNALFTGAPDAGDAAKPALVAALQAQGFNISAAFYGALPLSPPPPSRGLRRLLGI